MLRKRKLAITDDLESAKENVARCYAEEHADPVTAHHLAALYAENDFLAANPPQNAPVWDGRAVLLMWLKYATFAAVVGGAFWYVGTMPDGSEYTTARTRYAGVHHPAVQPKKR